MEGGARAEVARVLDRGRAEAIDLAKGAQIVGKQKRTLAEKVKGLFEKLGIIEMNAKKAESDAARKLLEAKALKLLGEVKNLEEIGDPTVVDFLRSRGPRAEEAIGKVEEVKALEKAEVNEARARDEVAKAKATEIEAARAAADNASARQLILTPEAPIGKIILKQREALAINALKKAADAKAKVISDMIIGRARALGEVRANQVQAMDAVKAGQEYQKVLNNTIEGGRIMREARENITSGMLDNARSFENIEANMRDAVTTASRQHDAVVESIGKLTEMYDKVLGNRDELMRRLNEYTGEKGATDARIEAIKKHIEALNEIINKTLNDIKGSADSIGILDPISRRLLGDVKRLSGEVAKRLSEDPVDHSVVEDLYRKKSDTDGKLQDMIRDITELNKANRLNDAAKDAALKNLDKAIKILNDSRVQDALKDFGDKVKGTFDNLRSAKELYMELQSLLEVYKGARDRSAPDATLNDLVNRLKRLIPDHLNLEGPINDRIGIDGLKDPSSLIAEARNKLLIDQARLEGYETEISKMNSADILKRQEAAGSDLRTLDKNRDNTKTSEPKPPLPKPEHPSDTFYTRAKDAYETAKRLYDELISKITGFFKGMYEAIFRRDSARDTLLKKEMGRLKKRYEDAMADAKLAKDLLSKDKTNNKPEVPVREEPVDTKPIKDRLKELDAAIGDIIRQLDILKNEHMSFDLLKRLKESADALEAITSGHLRDAKKDLNDYSRRTEPRTEDVAKRADDLAKMDQAMKDAKTRLENMIRDIEKLRQEIRDRMRDHEEAGDVLDRIAKDALDAKKLEDLLKKAREFSDKIEDANGKRDRLDMRDGGKDADKADAIKDRDRLELEDRLKELELQRKRLEGELARIRDGDRLRKAEDDLRKAREELAKLEDKLREIEDKLKEAKDKKDKNEAERKRREEERDRLKDEIDKARDRLREKERDRERGERDRDRKRERENEERKLEEDVKKEKDKRDKEKPEEKPKDKESGLPIIIPPIPGPVDQGMIIADVGAVAGILGGLIGISPVIYKPPNNQTQCDLGTADARVQFSSFSGTTNLSSRANLAGLAFARANNPVVSGQLAIAPVMPDVTQGEAPAAEEEAPAEEADAVEEEVTAEVPVEEDEPPVAMAMAPRGGQRNIDKNLETEDVGENVPVENVDGPPDSDANVAEPAEQGQQDIPIIAPLKTLQQLKELQPTDSLPRNTERPIISGRRPDYMSCFYRLWDAEYTNIWRTNFISGYESYAPEYTNLMAANVAAQYSIDTTTLQVGEDEYVEETGPIENTDQPNQEDEWKNPYEDEL